MLFGDFEDVLDPGNLPQIRVINVFRCELFHLFFRYEASLVAITLSGQVLSTVVSYCFLVDSALFLCPVPLDLVVPGFVDV